MFHEKSGSWQCYQTFGIRARIIKIVCLGKRKVWNLLISKQCWVITVQGLNVGHHLKSSDTIVALRRFRCILFKVGLSQKQSWWRHQMETFSALPAICARNSPVTGEFLAQRPVTRSFDVFFYLRWINGYVNNGEAGDLRRHHIHYDVTVMIQFAHISAAVSVNSLRPDDTYMCQRTDITWTDDDWLPDGHLTIFNQSSLKLKNPNS